MTTQTNKQLFCNGFWKVLEEQWEVDLRLRAGDSDEGSAINAHKLALASRSDVFMKMLETDEVNTSTEKIGTMTFSEMKHEELEAFVEFLYSDGSSLSAKQKQHVRALYLAADKYDIMHLRDLCRNRLISTLNTNNALDCLEISQIPFDEVLRNAAFNLIKSDIATIANSANFQLFVNKHPDLVVEIMKTVPTTRTNLVIRQVRTCSVCGQRYVVLK